MLMGAAERSDADEKNLMASAYETIAVLVANSARDCDPTLGHLCKAFIDRLGATFERQVLSADDRERRTELQGHLCGVLLALAQRLETRVQPYADRMMALFLKIFQESGSAGVGSVYEDALMAVGAVANAVGPKFERYMRPVSEHVWRGLGAFQQYLVCLAAVGAVGDICRALCDKMLPYCDRTVKMLLVAVKSDALHRVVKPHIIASFGDVAFAIGGNFKAYLHDVCGTLNAAHNVRKRPDDDEFCEYVDALRESIFEAYTGILQGLRADNQAHLFKQYCANVVTFIERVWADEERTEEQTRGAVGVLGDIAHSIGPDIAPALRRQTVKNILIEGCRSSDAQTSEIANWAAGVIRECLQS
jgi:importin subunit beta-1